MFSLDLGNLLVHLKMDDTLFSKSILGLQKGISSAVTNITRQTKRLALAATAYGIASTKAFASFEEQMSFVSTMLDDQTMNLMPKYTKAVRNMSVNFGESTQTISRGLYNILSASVAPAKALGVLSVSLKAAKAGMTDTATATYAITGILNAYSMSASKAGKVSDILFSTVKRGQTTFAQLAPSIGRVTSIAATSGVKLEEVAAALSTITRAGISTDQAVTFLRSSLIALQGKSEEGIEVAKSAAVELSEQALRTKQLSGMIEELSRLSEEQVNTIFKDIRSRQAIIVLLAQHEGQMKDLQLAYKASGMTQEAYDKMTKTLAHTLRQLWQSIKYVAVSVGSELRPSIERMSEFFIKNREVIAGWAVAFYGRIDYVMNKMMDFLVFMKEDFNKGIKFGLDVTIELFKGFGETLMLVMEDIFTRLYNSVGVWMKRSFAEAIEYERMYQKKWGELTYWGSPWKGEGKKKEAQKYAEEQIALLREQGVFETAYPIIPLKVDSSRYEKVIENTKNKIKELSQDYGLSDILKTEESKTQLGMLWDYIKESAKPYEATLSAIKGWHVDIYNSVSSILHNTTKWQKAASKITPEMIAAGNEFNDILKALDMERKIQGLVNQGFEHAREYIEAEKVAMRALGLETIKTAEQQAQLDAMMEKVLEKIEAISSGNRGLAAFSQKMNQYVLDATNMWSNFGDVATNALDSLSDTITDFIIDGTADWKRFTSDILRMFVNSLVRMQVAAAAAELFDAKTGFVTNFVKSLFGGGETWNQAKASMASPNYYGNQGFAEGGIAWTPQLAKVAEKEPEVITPFSKMGQLFETQQPKVTVDNKLKVVNVFDREEMLAAMQSDKGEKVILNMLRRKGII